MAPINIHFNRSAPHPIIGHCRRLKPSLPIKVHAFKRQPLSLTTPSNGVTVWGITGMGFGWVTWMGLIVGEIMICE